MSDKPNADTTKKPTTATESVAQQSPPIDTTAAQLVYDDLRRFCEARRSDIASIITRSQFLLVLTSSLYAAYFIARPGPMAFSLLEAIAALVMLPAVAMLLQSGRPLGYFDYILDAEVVGEDPLEICRRTLNLMRNLAEGLLRHNYLRGKRLERGYRVWLASLLASVILLVLEYI